MIGFVALGSLHGLPAARSESHRAYTNRMNGVETWDPGAAARLGERQVELIRKANLNADDLGLNAVERSELAPLMAAGAEVWAERVDAASSEELVSWIRFLTLAEVRFPGFEAGAKSPVILIARILRGRGDYPEDLTAWIKANTDNRFLPYGSLADRLGTGP